MKILKHGTTTREFPTQINRFSTVTIPAGHPVKMIQCGDKPRWAADLTSLVEPGTIDAWDAEHHFAWLPDDAVEAAHE